MTRTRRGRKSKSGARRPKRAAATAVTLSDDWREWVAENLVAGVDATDLQASLVARGVSASLARAEVEGIARSPLLTSYRRLARRAQQLELVATLQRVHLAFAEAPEAIERRTWPAAREFFDRYYALNTPAVFTDVVERWPAAIWTPESLRERLTDVRMDVCTGREADPEPDRNFASHVESMTFAELVDRVRAAGVSNDIYLIANNRALQRPELACLLEDVAPDPSIFDPDRKEQASSLWVGPAGTVTPLHHDVSNILFCQIYGSKRVTLIPPCEVSLLDGLRGFYAAPAHPPVPNVAARVVELAPGEALFIPAGWLHHVEALSVSINFSLLCFRRPNDFSWFNPGRADLSTLEPPP